MASNDGLFGWLFRPFRKKQTSRKKSVMVLNRPLQEPRRYNAVSMHEAKYQIGQVVRHRAFPFRGVIFDVDPQFSNSDEWYESIPEEVRPRKNQPYYHLFAENDRTHYVAYVSEQNLLPDDTQAPLNHPDITDVFTITPNGGYELKKSVSN
jgi:heat shock protein HspQ